jgi:hypothetical protein
MKLLILTVLLSVAQANPPIPRQTSNSPASASDNVQKKTKDKDTPTSPTPPLINQGQSKTTNGNANQQGSDNAEHSIAVSKLPPVTVLPTKRDWVDWGIWAFSGLLVIVGFLQWRVIKIQASLLRKHAVHLESLAIAAKNNAVATQTVAEATQKTTDGIREQVDLMEKQTKAIVDTAEAAKFSAAAADKNLEMIISKERARIRVKPKELNLSPKPLPIYGVDFTVSISGASAAFIIDAQCCAYSSPKEQIGVGYDAFTLQFEILDVISPNIAPINCSTIFLFGIPDAADEIPEIKADRLFVELRGFIKYKDVFDRERETRFRYVWKFSPYAPMDGERFGYWEECGEEADNAKT